MPSPNRNDWIRRWPAIVALLWAGSTYVAWCLAWSVPTAGLSEEASLTVLGLFSLFVSVAIRFPRLFAFAKPAPAVDSYWSESAASTQEIKELIWLGAWAGQVNMLGVTSLIAPSLASVLPAVLVTLVVEALLFRLAPRDWQQTVSKSFDGMRAPSTVNADAVNSSAANDSLMRSCVQGRSENGVTYLQGWAQFELEAGQKACTLTVVFSPAFTMVPDVDLDQELEAASGNGTNGDTDALDCEVRLEHVTPSGMRVVIKRSRAASSCRGKLLWYATPAEAHGVVEQRPPRDRLP